MTFYIKRIPTPENKDMMKSLVDNEDWATLIDIVHDEFGKGRKIGREAVGWKFTMYVRTDADCEPEYGSYKRWLQSMLDDGWRICDEYDRDVTMEEYVGVIEDGMACEKDMFEHSLTTDTTFHHLYSKDSAGYVFEKYDAAYGD